MIQGGLLAIYIGQRVVDTGVEHGLAKCHRDDTFARHVGRHALSREKCPDTRQPGKEARRVKLAGRRRSDHYEGVIGNLGAF
jgi:hypothetical protein